METPSPYAYPDHWEADVVLRDGGTARIRPITTGDAERLVSFYEQVSDESKYYRFFAPYPRLSAKDVHRFTHHDYVDRVGLAVTLGGEFIATVRYDRIDNRGRPASAPADEAEVAFLVQDAHQGRGIASALLEHISAVARERGIRRFTAEVLPANNKMIKVFRDAGFTQDRHDEAGSVRLDLDLEPTARSLAVQRGREQRAEARSVQRLLAPGSVAVVGTGRATGSVGRTVLRALLRAGFTGRLHAVNSAFAPDLHEIDGVPAVRSVSETGTPVDLAVVVVPARRVPEVVADCGEHGVRGLLILSAEYAESGTEGAERQRQLVRQARSYGMRLIGPNAFGISNTADDVRLNASLTPDMPATGRIGLFAQSGAIAIALLSGLHRRGAGPSSFVSVGNGGDVSGNDLLQYWYEDPHTDVVLMYLESLGDPRKFTRLARRTAAVKPVVVVQSARRVKNVSPGHGQAENRIPASAVSALMGRAGVIQVATVTEMVDVGLLLAAQPLPEGPRIAILGNSESLGVLTFDACLAEGLHPLPPVDLTTAALPGEFRAALASALADPGCDAVVVTVMPGVPGAGETMPPPAGGALARVLQEAVANGPAKPVTVVHVEIEGLPKVLAEAREGAPDPPETGVLSVDGPDRQSAYGEDSLGGLDDQARQVPAAAAPTGDGSPGAGAIGTTRRGRIPEYPAAERAVRALSAAVGYTRWRRQAADPGKVPGHLDDSIDTDTAATLIDRSLGADPDSHGLSLAPADTAELLGLYGITVLPTMPAPDPDAAAEAAARLGYPVALKATATHLRHRADLGGVRLDLNDEARLRSAYRQLTESLGEPAELRPVVQSMAPRGVDTVVRAVLDSGAGAVLSFGLAGAASELLGDLAHRLVPATDRDVAELVRSIRTAPLLFGWRGSAPVDTPALEELLLRVSRLVDDHPGIVAVTLEPVVVAVHGLSVLGATVRLAPPRALDDLGPRRLPAS